MAEDEVGKGIEAAQAADVSPKEDTDLLSEGVGQIGDTERMNVRFFERAFPKQDEVVMVKVLSIQEMGAYTSLLEYGGIEGMILMSELSRRRYRSINKLIRVGKLEVVMVIRVDEQKGYIDLSKRRVDKEDILRCEERYNRGKAVHSIMKHVAETTGSSHLELMQKVAWPLVKPPFETAFEAFKMAIAEPEKILGTLDVDENIKEALLKVIRLKMTPQPIKIRADIQVICYQPEGIDAIKAALKAGESVEDGSVDAGDKAKSKVKIKLIAPPKYVMLTTSVNKKEGIEFLNKAIEAVDKKITERKGQLTVVQKPYVTSNDEENQLKSLMEQMEFENREVDGDDDVELAE